MRAAAHESRFENFDRDFHEKLRQAFLDIARRNPDRCAVIDAGRRTKMRWRRRSGRRWRADLGYSPAWPNARASANRIESDRIEGFPHPRETAGLIGQDAALARAARAIRGGTPPQGWLISGPPGIGKATLAYRIARYLLAYGAARYRRRKICRCRRMIPTPSRSRRVRIRACWC